MSSARVISFASGKGGVGKTTVVANLGCWLASQNQKTLLIDGDWSLGKLSILFGIRPKWTVERVIEGELGLSDAIETIRPNLDLLASPTGRVGYEELTEESRTKLFYELDALRSEYDWVLFDHSSGVHWGVLAFAAAAHQHVIVTTSEPTSYTDAYAIMKILSNRFQIRDFKLLVTMSSNQAESKGIISRFIDVAVQHLNVRVELVDIVSWDARLTESIRRQQPFIDLFPNGEFSKRLTVLEKALTRNLSDRSGLSFFYENELKPAATAR